MITDAPWYVSNKTSHTDLNISYVRNVIKDKNSHYHTKLTNHTYRLLHYFLNPPSAERILKRLWPTDLRKNWEDLLDGEDPITSVKSGLYT